MTEPLTCTECDGERSIECPECRGGSGYCETCQEHGEIDCPWCGGSGNEPEAE